MMGVTMTIMQATDWKKYSFEEWCRQLGAWTNGDNERMIRIVRTAPTKRITQKQREKLLATYMKDDQVTDRLRVRRTGTCCQLDDNEARAIRKLFLDLKSIEDEVVQEWVGTIWSHYVMGDSVRDIAKSNDTYISRIQQDIKCGLAFIKSRYPHFKIDKFTKVKAEDNSLST